MSEYACIDKYMHIHTCIYKCELQFNKQPQGKNQMNKVKEIWALQGRGETSFY